LIGLPRSAAEKGIVGADVAENTARPWKSKKPFKQLRIMGAGYDIRRGKFQEFYAAVADFLRENVTEEQVDQPSKTNSQLPPAER
jgi:hypothetical protein